MRREGKVNNVRTSQTVKFCGCQTCARSGAHNRRRQGFGVNVCTCDDGKVKRGLKKSAMLVNLPQNCLQADQKVLMRKAKHRDFGDVYQQRWKSQCCYMFYQCIYPFEEIYKTKANKKQISTPMTDIYRNMPEVDTGDVLPDKIVIVVIPIAVTQETTSTISKKLNSSKH